MTATDAQVRIIMREREKGRTQEQTAASANLRSRKTAAKHERMGQLPSTLKRLRSYRTRADPFVEGICEDLSRKLQLRLQVTNDILEMAYVFLF